MAKNMYQKRKERKEKLIENNDVQGGVNKSVINWGIGTYRQQPLNPYK